MTQISLFPQIAAMPKNPLGHLGKARYTVRVTSGFGCWEELAL